MSVREIRGSLKELSGVKVSPDLVSRVTDAVLEEVRAWQTQTLESVYPIVIFDALRVKIRDEGIVRNKAVSRALAIIRDGLGIWIENQEGATFWNERRNRDLPANELNSDRPRRGAEGLSRGDQRGLPADRHPDLYRPSRPPRAELLVRQRSQHRGRRPQEHPSRRDRRRRRGPARPVRATLGRALSLDQTVPAAERGEGRPLLRLPRRHPQNHRHLECNRELAHDDPKDHQDPRLVLERRGRTQAHLPGYQGCRADREDKHTRMEDRPQPVRYPLRGAAERRPLTQWP